MFDLQGRISLVIGAGSGIGQAIAQVFARHETFVWVLDREANAGRAIVEFTRTASGRDGSP